MFVIGPMRSGTTLLRLALDAHPDLAIPEETAFMVGGAGVVHIPGWRYGDVWFERVGLPRAELLERLRQFYEGIFERYASAQGSSRWGEKTPAHVFHMELLAEIFPDASFVGIVRHPAAVVSSMVTSWRRAPETAAGYWRRASTEVVRAGRLLGDERFVLTRYEDLVQEPTAVLRDVCHRCGLAWDESVLRHDLVQRDRGAPVRTDGATESRRPVDTSAVSSWTARLDPVARTIVERETGELARWLGYRLDDPWPAPWQEDGRPAWSLGATSLDRRASRPGAPRFEVQTEDPLDLEADVETLAARAARAERELANLRRRRSVRFVDAVRRAQRAGFVGTVRDVLGGERSAQQ